jgi:hypothetical protein
MRKVETQDLTCSYIETQDLTGGPEVDKTICSRALMAISSK